MVASSGMADLLQRMATSKPRRILQAAPAHDGAVSWVYAPAEGQTKQVIEETMDVGHQ